MEAWTTVVVLVLLVTVLVREIATPPAAVVAALFSLVLLGVADAQVALTGFSSTATATVAGLFVVARALSTHAGLERAVATSLGGASSERGLLARLCIPVGAASAVMANTPVVAALAPVVQSWATRSDRSPSRLLMPLSFCSILGGMMTTIGTSTTLVASGIVGRTSGEPFGLLEVTPLGLPVAIVGTVVVLVAAPYLLPSRALSQTVAGDRVYTFRMVVVPDGPLDGMQLVDAGLRDLGDVFVASIDRGRAGIVPARPDSRLAGGDVLIIAGEAQHMRSLPTVGLRHTAWAQLDALGPDRIVLHEVVVGRGSALVGRTLKDVSFRGRYGAAVVAIDRAGGRIEANLGTEPLQSGDVLLLQAGDEFVERWQDADEFAVVARLDRATTAGTSRRPLVIAITAGMVVIAGLGVVSLLEAVLWACAALAVTRTIDFREAIASLDLDVLLIIASAIGIGAVVEESGLAATIADGVGGVAGATSATVGLVLLLVVTAVLTEVVTNVASAALMVPIAMSTAASVGADPRGWAIAVAIGASASFLTPIGYQTNTIVYGLGGYRFTDFWRLGLPLVVTSIGTALLVVPMVWG